MQSSDCKASFLKLVAAVAVAVVMIVANNLVLSQLHEEALRQATGQQEENMKLLRELLRVKGGEFRIEQGALWHGSYRINGNYEIPDTIFGINGSRATIFQGNTRVATNVLLPDGRRAIGTTLTGPAYRAVFVKGAPYRGEAPVLGVPYFTAYDPIRDSGGRIIGALFVGTDKEQYLGSYRTMSARIRLINGVLAVLVVLVTSLLFSEQKRSQKAMEKQLSFLRVLSDTIPSPIFCKDAEGRYSGCNQAFQRFIGLSREELIGKEVHELWPGELADLYREKDRELMEKTGQQTYEAKVLSSDGVQRDVIFNKATFWDESGTPGGIVGIIVDITARKAAEEELRQASQRTADIIEFLPDGAFVIDHEKRVIAWNRAMEQMTGVPKEQMIGRGELSYALPFYGVPRKLLIDLLDEEQDAVRRSYQNGDRDVRTIFGEVTLKGYRGGEDRIFRAAAAPLLDREGNRVGGIQTMRDITELRRATEQKHRLEAQLHHSKMMEMLLVQLSHDLRTPLTPLFALLPLIEGDLQDAQQQRMLELCRKSAGQIQQLTDKTLKLVRLSSQENRPVLQPLELRAVAQEAMAGVEPLLAKRQARCLNELDPELMVLGAADQLPLLFHNLLENAARYAADRGTVRIRGERKGGAVEVSVEDDGVGLDPEHTSLIFCEFFKADRARHDLDTQGLGLAICQRIVANHGGSIRAASRGRGLGTTIHFTLPGAGADAGGEEQQQAKGRET